MEAVYRAAREITDRKSRLDTGMQLIMLCFLVAFVVEIRAQVLTRILEFVGGMEVINISISLRFGSIVVTAAKAQA